MNSGPEDYLKSKRFNVGRRKGGFLGVPEIDARKAVRMARLETAKQILKEMKKLEEEMDNDQYNSYPHSRMVDKLEDVINAEFLQEKDYA